MKAQYQFSSKPWQYPAPGGWHFLSLPKKLSQELRTEYKSREEGWGRLRVTAQIGSSEWNAAIWFDTKSNSYMLPLKAEIRKKENFIIDRTVKVIVFIL